MKLKINVDQAAIKMFFLEQSEKIVFGAIVLCFGLIVYGAVGRGETFDKQPDDLVDSAANAEDHIKRGELPPVPYRDYLEIAKNNSQPIEFEDYLWEKPLDKPLRPFKPLRDTPPLVNVQELRAVAGRTALQLPAQRGAQDPRRARGGPQGFRYAVLTGLIPKKKQEFLYGDYFRDRVAYNPERDVPQYLWYAVERAEVEGMEEPAEADFVPLNLQQGVDMAKLWSGHRGGRGEELADPKYVHPALTFPLPPRVSGTWGKEVVHPDEIPLPAPVEQGMGERRFMGTAGVGGAEVPGAAETPGVPRIPGIPEGVAIPGMPGEEEGTRVPEPETMRDLEPDHLLFRFFDFSVQPGRKYRYRVKLWLVNPNYGLDPRYLKDTSLKDLKYIEPNEWTEPTEVVEVPTDSELLLLAVKAPPPTRVAGEPTAELGIVHWVSDTGATVYEDFEGIRRGGVLDFPNYEFPGGKIEEEKPARRPRGDDDDRRPGRGRPGRGAGEGEYMEREFMEAPAPPARPAGRGRFGQSEAVKVDYVTGAIVLDIRGGERIASHSGDRRPGSMLLLDADGNLAIHHELEDAEAFGRRKARVDGPEGPERARPGGMPRGMEIEGFEGGPPLEMERGFEGAPGFEWEGS